tara:strand:- start:4565 stop:5161 length:597 start_codon:yes stop_codon:yes gene_type:complete
MTSEKNIEFVFPNKKYGTETKIFGDSLKIIYEYKGDTVLQKRIDLKGIWDDDFDSSFNIMSIWSTRMTSELNCSQNFKLNQNNVEFNFCIEDVIDKIENDIEKYAEKPWLIKNHEKLKKELLEIKSGKLKKLTERTDYLTFELIREINFSAYDNETKSNAEKVRIENYQTDFSGGKNYYFINKGNDTIAKFSLNEWIK